MSDDERRRAADELALCRAWNAGWFDAGAFDTQATLTDALFVAGGVLVLYVIQMVLSPRLSSDKPLQRQ